MSHKLTLKSVTGYLLIVLRAVSCFHQGIIFEGGQEVLLTDSHWRVTLKYNLTEMQVQSQNLSELVVEVKKYLDDFYSQLIHNIT